MKTPQEKIDKYESFLNILNYAQVAGNKEVISRLLSNSFNWSYAHRVGNGTIGEEEQQKRIDRAFDRLTELA